jgi:hypothetical protein
MHAGAVHGAGLSLAGFHGQRTSGLFSFPYFGLAPIENHCCPGLYFQMVRSCKSHTGRPSTPETQDKNATKFQVAGSNI